MAYTWHYYDLVLGAIAASILVGTGVGLLTWIPLTAAVVVSGTVAALFVVHALFVRGPVDRPDDLTQEVDVELLE